MKREFSKLGTEASIKNTLPSVNEDNENKQAIVPYRSRSGSIEVLPQEEYPFEVGSSGKAIYYMKQERENLKTVGLYEDKEPTPPTPVGDNIYYKDTEGSDVDFNLRDQLTKEIVEVGSNLVVGREYRIKPTNESSNHYLFFINNVEIGEDETVYFTLTEDMAVEDKIVIAVKEPSKKYIYEKGEDSDVSFVLFKDSVVPEGTNLTVGEEYKVIVNPVGDVYINGVKVAEDVSGAGWLFTLTEDMSINDKVVITVKSQGGQNPKLMVKNSNAPGTGISTYTDDYQFVETIASFYQGQSGEVEIPLNTIIGISGMNFQATFSGTYGGVEYNDQQLMVEGNSFVYSPEGYKFWTNFQEGDEGTLTV